MREWEHKLLALMYAESCSYQSVNHYFAGETTVASIPLPIQEKGYHYRLVLGHSSPFLSMQGADVVAYADSLRIGAVDDIRTQYAHETMVSSIAGFANATGIPNIAGEAVYASVYQHHPFAQMTVLGLLKEEHRLLSVLPEQAEDYSLVFVGSLGQDHLLAQHLLKANAAWLDSFSSQRQRKQVLCRHIDHRGVVYAALQFSETAGIELHLSSTEFLSVTACDAYLWAIPANLVGALLTHYNQTFALPDIISGSAALEIGRIGVDGQCRILLNGETLVDMPARDLRVLKSIVRDVTDTSVIGVVEPVVTPPEDYNDVLLQLLAHENIASREMIYEHYDKQVQGRTRIEPGEAEAGLIQLFYEERFPPSMRGLGVALAVASNPFYHDIDPYFAAMNSVALALRKVASVGASPQAISFTLYSGNVEHPEQMGIFSESVCGISDACRDYELKEYPGSAIPVIAGEVSFASPGGAAPMLACIGTITEVDKAVTSAFRYEDSCVLMVGERQEECGGSVYYQLRGEQGYQLPIPKLSLVAREIYALLEAIQQSLVLSCGVIHKGGLAVAIAKMCIPRHMGVTLTVPGAMSVDQCLFAETGGFLLEVAPEYVSKIEAIFSQYDVGISLLGRTTFDHRMRLQGTIDLSVAFAEEAWRHGLREKLL